MQDFEVGETYEQKVVLMNSTHAMTSCKLVGMSEELKDFISINESVVGLHTVEFCVINRQTPLLNLVKKFARIYWSCCLVKLHSVSKKTLM